MISKEEQATFYKVLGDRIKKLRKKLNISQDELAKELGFVSRISIVQIESGKQKISLHTLIELSDILNTTLSGLLPPLTKSKKTISSNLVKQLSKELAKETSDPITHEKLESFIRLSTLKKNN